MGLKCSEHMIALPNFNIKKEEKKPAIQCTYVHVM